jgi:hypothetical protein
MENELFMFSKLISNHWFRHSYDPDSEDYQIAQRNIDVMFKTLDFLSKNIETRQDILKSLMITIKHFIKDFDMRCLQTYPVRSEDSVRLNPFIMIGNYWNILQNKDRTQETYFEKVLKKSILMFLYAFNNIEQTDMFMRYIDFCDVCDRRLAFHMISHVRLGSESNISSYVNMDVLYMISGNLNVTYTKYTQDESRKFITEKMRHRYADFVLKRLDYNERILKYSQAWDSFRFEMTGTYF